MGRDPAPSQEFTALASETNPEIFYEGFLALGQRLEAENRLEAASQVYAALVTDPSPSRERVPEGRVRASFHDIRRRAQQRLDAMTGTGSSAHRSEFLLRHLARETMEPTTLVGLTAASAAFRMTRLASLSRLLGSPTINFATRGFGARAAASLMGFVVEATVFPLASRGAAAALGRDLDWSFNQVGREIAGSFIVLGAMKLTGWAAATLGNQNVGANLVFARPGTVLGGIGRSQGSPLQGILQQTGMLTGILLGHHLETAVGLRPHVDGATTFVDSLAMLIQFNAAGRLAHGMMGQGFRTWELALDQQARSLASEPSLFRGRGHPTWWPLRGIMATAAGGHMGPPLQVGEGGRRPGEGSRRFSLDTILHMASHSGDGGEGAGGKGPPRKPTPFPTLLGVGPIRDPRMRPTPPEGNPPRDPGTSREPAPEIRPELPAAVPPERKSTLPGIPAPGGTRITRPEGIPAARRGAEAPRSPSTPQMQSLKIKDYIIEGMPPDTPVYRVPALPAGDAVTRAADFIARQLKTATQTTVFELHEILDTRQQTLMRMKMLDIFRDLNSLPGLMVVLAIPPAKAAILYNYRAGSVHGFPVSLKEAAFTGPRRPSTFPPAGTSERKTADRPTPTAALSSGTGLRGDSVQCQTFEELKQALREILAMSPAERGISPALSLLQGTLGSIELQSLAPLFLEHPLNEGNKILISWRENPGRLIFHRSGDRLLAQLRGIRIPQQDYVLFPRDQFGNELLILPESTLRQYTFHGWQTYETEVQKELADMMAALPESVASQLGTIREEGGAYRGRLLAFVAQQVLRGGERNWITLPPEDQGLLTQVQTHLEKSYTFLDFDTVNHFRQRLGQEKLRRYNSLIQQLNHLPSSGKKESLSGLPSVPQWLAPTEIEMPTNIPGYEFVPKPEHLRGVFLAQLFADSGGGRSPRETLALLSDMDRLGRMVGAAFRNRLSNFPARRARLPGLAPRESLASFLRPEKTGFTSLAQELREQMIEQLRDLGEFGRIFFEGKGTAHRHFLNMVFNGPQGIAPIYRQLHGELAPLPPEVKTFLGLPVLPPEERLQRYIGGLPTQP